MARQTVGPWFRRSKNCWYATVDGGRMESLGIKGEANRAEAIKAWHRLMAELPITPPKADVKPPNAGQMPEVPKEQPEIRETVQSVINAFLLDAESRISSEAFRGYCKFLEPFSKAFGERQVESITPTEAEAFARKPQWSATYQANFLGCLMTAFRWAERQGLVHSSPVEHIQKPTKKSRGTSAVITKQEHKKLLSVADATFRDYLSVLWETGGRPAEIAGLTAEQVNASSDCVIPLTEHKTAHKGKSRHLVLTSKALSIVKRRARAAGSGLLFGRLTPKAVCSKMARLCRKAGIRRLMAYGYRHTFATDALANGVPDATVAALLGHSSTAMLHKHYSHLTARADVLRKAVGQVR
jgi:integrase/recombinase XerC